MPTPSTPASGAQAAATPTARPAGSASSAEPTDADLLKILTGQASKPVSSKAASEADEVDDNEEDADLDSAEEDELGGDDGAADGDEDEDGAEASAEADADTEGDETDEDAAAEEEDKPEDENADDPDAALDAEAQAVRAKFTPKQQKLFDKAVSKKTRRILELKTQLTAAQTAAQTAQEELDKVGTAAPRATADNPLGDVDTEQKLDARLTETRKLRRFALANPDGAFVDKKTGAVVAVEDPDNPPDNVVRFDKKRIGELLAETEETLQEHGPKQRAFLQQRTQADAAAANEFPWLKNKQSQGYIAVESTLREAPQLRSIPGIKFLLADAFLGRQVRLSAKQQQQQAAGKKPGAKGSGKPPPRAPASPAGGARAPRVAGAANVAEVAVKTVAKTGDDPGNAALRAILRS